MGEASQPAPLDTLAKVALQPAQIMGLNAGYLLVGAAADVCIFDPEIYWIKPAALKSQDKNIPFNGMELQGKVLYTLVDGQVVAFFVAYQVSGDVEG